MTTPDDPFAAPDPSQTGGAPASGQPGPPGQPGQQPPAAPFPPQGYGQAPPPGYGQVPPAPPPGTYGQAPPAPAYGYTPPPQQGTNGLAIASIVCSVAGLVTCGLTAVVGMILGFVARGQIKRSGQEGRGLALAGIWVGAAVTAIAVVATAVIVAFGIWAVDKSEACRTGEHGPVLSQQWFDADCDTFYDFDDR